MNVLARWEDVVIGSKEERKRATDGEKALDRDARALHGIMAELVRVYQFRDRNRIMCFDISVTQCYAISVLAARDSMTLNELAAELYIEKSTASRAVDSLEDKEYVSRSTDPEDGRALRIEVTAKGLELLSRIEEGLIDEMKKLLADFDPEVRQATARLVARFTRTAKSRFSKSGSCAGTGLKKR